VNETLRGLDEGGGFVSGLGKAALANPSGPLAVLSHIDLAWSYSYEELRVGGDHDSRRVSGSNRSLNFFQLISKLMSRTRARAALAVAGGDSPGVVAAQLGMARSELIEAAEAYREAGRAALSELLARREPEKGRGG